MKGGATVSFASEVPLWQFPSLLRVCLEAASHLDLWLGAVSVRFYKVSENMVTAEIAWGNDVFAQIYPCDEYGRTSNSQKMMRIVGLGMPSYENHLIELEKMGDAVKEAKETLKHLAHYCVSKRLHDAEGAVNRLISLSANLAPRSTE